MGRGSLGSDGIDFSELTDFKNDCLELAKEMYPKEIKKFLKGEGKKQTDIVKKKVRAVVKKKTGKYLRGFKTGKVYKYDGDDTVRTYNGMPHAHLLELGHEIVPRGKRGASNKGGSSFGRVKGNNLLAETNKEFETEFEKDVEKFISDFLDGAFEK